MTDLRKLLSEARNAVDAIRNEHKTHGHITDASAHWLIKIKPRIDAALAEPEQEPVEPKFREFRGCLKPVDRGMWVNGPSNFYSASEVDAAIDTLQSELKRVTEELKTDWYLQAKRSEEMATAWEREARESKGRAEAAESLNKRLVELLREPYGYIYVTNNTWTHFTTRRPPDDAYDEGSLVPVYAMSAELLKEVK